MNESLAEFLIKDARTSLFTINNGIKKYNSLSETENDEFSFLESCAFQSQQSIEFSIKAATLLFGKDLKDKEAHDLAKLTEVLKYIRSFDSRLNAYHDKITEILSLMSDKLRNIHNGNPIMKMASL